MPIGDYAMGDNLLKGLHFSDILDKSTTGTSDTLG